MIVYRRDGAGVIMQAFIGAEALSAVMFARFQPRPGRITMPDVCCDLVWIDECLTVAGPQSSARPSTAVGRQVQMLNVDPLVARTWLGVPLHELTDRKVPLADLAPRQVGWLAELFHGGEAGQLVRRTAGGPADPRAVFVDAALRRGWSVKDAAAAVGLSERQMERQCLDWFGLSPRRYRRILRLRQAVRRVKGGASLAEAALTAGYADQPHFNREVQALAGATPRALLPHVGNVQDAPVSLREY
jgi:AraC-like DNA-binding protein